MGYNGSHSQDSRGSRNRAQGNHFGSEIGQCSAYQKRAFSGVPEDRAQSNTNTRAADTANASRTRVGQKLLPNVPSTALGQGDIAPLCLTFLMFSSFGRSALIGLNGK